MSSSAVSTIDGLLNDKLFQVIGSTPTSIAESLRKLDLSGKTNEGAQLFAISVFAAAVNKSTLETFLADSRFASIRPLVNAAMSISGRSNMTALTLLGHCLLTTDLANNVNFTSEFRKKMGQNHLWDGTLTKGSLSDKQKEILAEKQRVTSAAEAKALGNGFLKWVGLDKSTMTDAENALFGTPRSSGGAIAYTELNSVPTDVINYRKNVLGQSNGDMLSSLNSRGLEAFIENTRKLIREDPTGSRLRQASSAGT